MRRLGEILLDKGALALPELHTALEACRRTGGRLGTQLLRFGFVSEQVLLAALTEQFRVPAVTQAIIQRSPARVRRLLPTAVAKRLHAVPFAVSGNVLRVAMANPRDPMVVDEVQTVTGQQVEPHVATEIAIVEALAEVDDEVVRGGLPSPETPAAPPVTVPSRADWDRLWGDPEASPDALRDLPGDADRSEVETRWATFPGLAPLSEDPAEGEISLDEASYVEGLQDARHRDEVAILLARFVEGFLPRVAVFMVHKGQIAGWIARGQSVVVDDVQTYSAALGEPSLLSDAAEIGEPGARTPGDSEADRRLVEVLGEPATHELLALPVQVRRRTIAVLVADIPGEAGLAVPVSELVAAATRAGLAFEMLIHRNKIAS